MQLVGAAALVAMVVSCSNKDFAGPEFVGMAGVVGLTLIIGARIYEWLARE